MLASPVIMRYIPTRVGKTCVAARLAYPPTVHPHACGENGLIAAHFAGLNGTSPRVWGKRHLIADGIFQHAVHPHACGENYSRQGEQENHRRYIPTRVGKTRRRTYATPPAAVHPHACGENAFHEYPSAFIAGTSPRVWGKPRSRSGETITPRYIPTRVGKTPPSLTACRCTSVHPHACGENGWHDRTIRNDYPVHPHACGENKISAYAKIIAIGTSPRVWGKRPPV